MLVNPFRQLLFLLLPWSLAAQSLAPVPVKDGTRFFYREPSGRQVTSVSVAGPFNGWNKSANPMSLNPSDSVWSAVVTLQPGVEYFYKLVLNDSLWITDPNAPNVTEDEWRNGIIIPQKYGAPYVAEAFPPQNKRVTSLPVLAYRLGTYGTPVTKKSIQLTLNGKTLRFSWDAKNARLTARLPASLADGEHTVKLSFADAAGNRNPGVTYRFFLDRYIKKISTPAAFDTLVMYEVYLRTFADGNGDGVGDFSGLASRLGYLRDTLGIGALWLMPFNESPAEHGYNVTDYFSIDREYGSFADYLAFLKEAKAKGIKVLMDFVINHTDSTHPFFLDAYRNPASKYARWFQFTDSTNTDWYHFGVERRMPKLDLDNPDVQAYMLRVAKFWLDPNGDGDRSDGVDGFRCDAAKEVSHTFWNRFRKEIKKSAPQTLLLGEVWDNAWFLIPFFKEEFDALFNYPAFYAVEKYFAANDIAALVKNEEDAAGLYPSGFQMVRFYANHDNNRALDHFNGSTEKFRQGLFLKFTLPGIPMLYYGDEVGMRGTLPPENVRGAMPWNEISRQMADPSGLLALHRSLIAVRAAHPALSTRHDKSTPSLLFLDGGGNGLLAYFRYTKKAVYLAVLNNSGKDVEEARFSARHIPLEGEVELENIVAGGFMQTKFGALKMVSLQIQGNSLFLKNMYLNNGGFVLFKLK